MLGRDRTGLAEAEADRHRRARLRRRAPRPCWRRGRPACRTGARDRRRRNRSGVRPALASMTKRTASASAIAASVWARMRPIKVSLPPSSRPAVSMTSELQVREPAVMHAAIARHPRRVVDKREFAADEPVEQVDLPTFGRPTIASVKLISWADPGGAGARRPGGRLVIRPPRRRPSRRRHAEG